MQQRADDDADASLLRRLLREARRLPVEFQTSIAFGVLVLGFLGFVAVAEDVLEGEPNKFDSDLLLALRQAGNPDNPIGPAWLEYAMRDITALGGYAVLTLIVVLSTLYLLLESRIKTALLLVSSIISGTLLVSILKIGFDRPRPDLVDQLTHATSSSFPSGHATSSALVYLTLSLLLAQAVRHRRLKLFLIASGVFIAILVGCSRVYLGVHWPSDVIAGWGLGAAWAMIWWIIARRLDRQH